MSLTLPRRKRPKRNIDREKLRVILLWVLLLGLLASFWLWSGCGPPTHPNHPVRSHAFAHTYTVPDSCKTLLDITTDNVKVVVQKDCVDGAPAGTTTAFFIILNTKDKGGEALYESGEILSRFFSAFELAPVAIVRTPAGQPAYLFVLTYFSFKSVERIQRDMHLQKRNLPK